MGQDVAVFKRSKDAKFYWYKFKFAGELIRESTKTESIEQARKAERAHRTRLEEAFNGVTATDKKGRLRTFSHAADEHLAAYLIEHPKSKGFITYAIKHLKQHLGANLLTQIDTAAVKAYRVARLKEENTGPKSVNEEVGELLRILGLRGDAIRTELKRKKSLKLATPKGPGKAYTQSEKDGMVKAAKGSRSFHIRLALALAQDMGTRAAEVRETQWSQWNFRTGIYETGKGKTAAGEGRTIPITGELLAAVLEHKVEYEKKFGPIRPDWYVFPFGRRGHMDPTRPVTTLKTSWNTVRAKAGTKGRWHDHRHTLITELAESGVGDQTIRDIAGHVSPAMQKHYSHVRIKAKREAMESLERNRKTIREENSAAEKLSASNPEAQL
jgi:integrase